MRWSTPQTGFGALSDEEDTVMTPSRVLRWAGVALVAAALASAQTPDPRTPSGQLAVCGGAAWQRIGFLEFEVSVQGPTGGEGPWHYRWDRSYGFFRLSGPGPDGQPVDVAVDIGSGTGGGWSSGKQLTGAPLEKVVRWSQRRFKEDVMWVTFPLEWGAAGVVVTPLPDTVGEDGVAIVATEVRSAVGRWVVTLDGQTGRIVRTVLERKGSGTLTADWSDWQQHGGVYFAGQRTIRETGETISVRIVRAQATPPADAF